MLNFNLSQLEAFAKVIELGSFSLAADNLNVTQPAISIRINDLEKALGVTLVKRSGKPPGKAVPTPAGEELLKHVRKIDQTVSMLQTNLAKFKAASN